MSRILWSVQIGVVLFAGGLGLLFVSNRVLEEVAQPLFSIGVLALAVGAGFVVSAGASFLLSRRLGLFESAPFRRASTSKVRASDGKLMRDLTFSDVERLEAAEVDVPFEMDEEAFRAFYDRTARSLWNYLSRMTCDPQVADDLLQESYYRFLRTRGHWESESHRRAYLFQIATNLVRDGRGAPGDGTPCRCPTTIRALFPRLAATSLRPASGAPICVGRWIACDRASGRCSGWRMPRAMPHTEIAHTLGVKTGSVKLLLFRARRKLAGILASCGGAHRRRPLVKIVDCCREQDVLDALTSGRWPGPRRRGPPRPRGRVRTLRRRRRRRGGAARGPRTTSPATRGSLPPR